MANFGIGYLFDYESPESRGERVHFRVFEFFVVISAGSLGWFWALKASRLTLISSPLGLARHFDLSFLLFPGVPFILAAILSLLCLIGFLRSAPGVSYGLAFLVFHILYVLRFSLGKVGHGSNFIGMSLLGLVLGMLFFNQEYHRRRFTLGFTYAFIGFAYVLAACSKLIGTGILWPDGHHLWMWVTERSIDLMSQTGSFEANPVQALVLKYKWVATGLLIFGLVTEAFGWLMWWPRYRPWFTIAAVLMHVGITIVMGIHFTLYIVELLLVGLPWSRFLDRVIFEASRSKHQPLHLHSVTHR